MKTLLIPAVFAIFLISCSQKETSEKETNVEETGNQAKIAAENAAFKKKRFEEYLPDFQKLVISYDGVVRGIDIGTTVDSLKQVEIARLSTSSANELVYNTELSEDESLEIHYFLKDGRVDGIEYSIGQGSNDEVSAFILEFTDFFTNKYGPVIPKENDEEVWKTPSGHEVSILDISKDKRYGLKIIVKK